MTRLCTLLILCLAAFFSCTSTNLEPQSPDGNITVLLSEEEQQLTYAIYHKDQLMVRPSGFEIHFMDQKRIRT